MTIADTLTDALICERTVIRMSNAFDSGDISAGLAHYAVDAVWLRPDGTLSGRDAIAAYYAARPANAVICHVLTNMQVDFTGPDDATCSYYSLGYREIATKEPRLPQPMSGAGVLWRYHDGLRRIHDQWQVISRRADRIYERVA